LSQTLTYEAEDFAILITKDTFCMYVYQVPWLIQ